MSIVVLVSGRGSNLQALLDAGIAVSAVISNVEGAGGLQVAQRAGIPHRVVPHGNYGSRDAFDGALAAAIDEFAPALVLLAGFMRVLTPGFVRRYEGRMLNIHPSLLPSFPGLHTHERALVEGVKAHGCTVHFVTAELDHGPIVAQAAVPVLANDTPDSLSKRVLRQEHLLFPRAVRWFLEGRLVIEQGRVNVKGEEADAHAQTVFSDRV